MSLAAVDRQGLLEAAGGGAALELGAGAGLDGSASPPWPGAAGASTAAAAATAAEGLCAPLPSLPSFPASSSSASASSAWRRPRRAALAAAASAAAAAGCWLCFGGSSPLGLNRSGPSSNYRILMGEVTADSVHTGMVAVQHLGGFCFGHAYTGTSGMLRFVLIRRGGGAQNWPETGILRVLAFDDEPKRWGKVQERWGHASPQELAEFANWGQTFNLSRWHQHHEVTSIYGDASLTERFNRHWHVILSVEQPRPPEQLVALAPLIGRRQPSLAPEPRRLSFEAGFVDDDADQEGEGANGTAGDSVVGTAATAGASNSDGGVGVEPPQLSYALVGFHALASFKAGDFDPAECPKQQLTPRVVVDYIGGLFG